MANAGPLMVPRMNDERELRLLAEDVIGPLHKWLGLRALGCLRGCSRKARAVVDRTLDSLSFGDRGTIGTSDERELPSGVAAGVRGMLSRGCTLHELTIWLSPRRNLATSTAFGLGILSELAVKPSLTKLTLQGLPLTAEVVRAITAAAPRPRALHLGFYRSSARRTGDPASMHHLLLHSAPHLAHLILCASAQLLCAPDLAPSAPLAAAPCSNLASLLQQCSRLESLELIDWNAAAEGPGVLRALAQLPALRSLTLLEPGGGVAAGCHLSALSSLSRLTHLVTSGGGDGDNLAVLLPAVAGMHSLVELALVCTELLTSQLEQLAALTALTSLSFEHLTLAPADPAPPAGGGGAAGGPAPGLLPDGPRLVQLPPRLRFLSLVEGLIGTDVLAALQLPPCLTRLVMQGLALPAVGATDEEGVLRPAAAEAVLVACRQLVGRRFAMPCAPLFHLDLGRAKAPATWQRLYGPLFAALRPLDLPELYLSCGPLTVRDVDSLVQQLPTLEVLGLQGALELAALPLLQRLDRLSSLYITLDGLDEEGELAEDWGNKAALGAVLLALCMQAPSLEEITLDFSEVLQGPYQEAAAAAQLWLAERLPHMRSKPLVLYLCNGGSGGLGDADDLAAADDDNIGVDGGDGDGSDDGDGSSDGEEG